MLLLSLLLGMPIPPSAAATPNRQPQLAAQGRHVAVAYGAGDAVYFAASTDAGATFGRPVLVSSGGPLSLGMHRGPRVAYTSRGIVVSAIVGEQGKGKDGDLLAWRSADGGKTWSGPVRVNDVTGAAREGLHAMAAGGKDTLFAAWLDLRAAGTRVYGATSADGGATWSANRLAYESPSGTVCPCCHPSVAVDGAGRVFVMFRNALEGSRDLYLTRSTDGGHTFEPARKLGRGTWKLDACPMDGGALAVDGDGRVTTVWRREDTLFVSPAEGPETALGPGRNAAAATTPRGTYSAWTEGKRLLLKRPLRAQPEVIAEDGGFPSIAALADGSVAVAWESNGHIVVRPFR
jgi:BNR repeat protein